LLLSLLCGFYLNSDGNLLNDIQCTVVNDELIVQTETGDNFSYDVNKPSTLRIQKALFHQKQRIIVKLFIWCGFKS